MNEAGACVLGVVWLACGGGVVGCGAPEPGDVGAEPSATLSELVYKGSEGQAYADACDAAGVPLPPDWGTSSIGSSIGGSVKWIDRGAYADSFMNDLEFGGHVYVSTPPALTKPGICVINQHAGGTFDIICQGANAEACFWEGHQNQTYIPPTAVKVIDNNFGAAAGQDMVKMNGVTMSQDTPLVEGVHCTNCHGGQNAFITHVTAAVGPKAHPLNLVGQSSWMPSNKMYDAVEAADTQNPPPETFAGYPTSTLGCLTCHKAQGPGGQFASLAQMKAGNYKVLLSSVVNRPASQGGMPQSIGECTPNLNCAAQTDPFVAKMLSDFGVEQNDVKYTLPANAYEAAHSDANSPVALNTYDVAGYPGFYDQVASWTVNALDVSEFELSYNPFTYNPTSGTWARQGWKNSPNPTSSMWPETKKRVSTWQKRDAAGNPDTYAIALTGIDGKIWVQELGGALTNATASTPASGLAAGAPSAYIRDDLSNVIVYRGLDSLIHELKWDGTVWNHTLLANQTDAVLSDPLAFNASGTNRIVFKCGNTTLCELRSAQTSPDHWQASHVTTAAKMKGTFMPSAATNPTSLYYVGVDGLHQLIDVGADTSTTPNYVDVKVSSDANIASAPSAYLRNDNATGVVYLSISGTTSSVVEASTTSPTGDWETHVRYKATGTLKHDPFGRQLMYQYNNSILFRGPNEELLEILDGAAPIPVYGKPSPKVDAFLSCGGPVPARVYWNPITVNGSAPNRDLGSIQDKFCYVNSFKQYDARVDGGSAVAEEVALAYGTDWTLGGWGNAPSGYSEISANCVRWNDLIAGYSTAPLSQLWFGHTSDGLTSKTAVPGGNPATNACMIAGISGNFSLAQTGDILLQGHGGDKTKPTDLVLKNETPSVIVDCVDTNLESRSPVVSAASRAKTFTWTNNNTGADPRSYAKDTGFSSTSSICYLTEWADTHAFGCSAGGCGGSQLDGASAWVADGSPIFKNSSGNVIKAGNWVVYGTGATKTVTASCQTMPF